MMQYKNENYSTSKVITKKYSIVEMQNMGKNDWEENIT